MINLLKETEKALKNHDVSFKNVRCIRNAEGYIPIAEFTDKASHFNYDNGCGEVRVDPTLVIIGSFWWLERESCDGLEGWVFHHKPKKAALPAIDFTLKNIRHSENTFLERVERCGGYFDETKDAT